MRVLAAGFEGDDNSAKVLLDRLPDSIHKLYLKNNKQVSVAQLLKTAEKYDAIVMFGQKTVLKNKVSVERRAALNGERLCPDFDFEGIQNFFADRYPLKFSDNAGTSYCNHLYYHAIKELSETNKKLVFIHVPMLKNIADFLALTGAIQAYIEYLGKL